MKKLLVIGALLLSACSSHHPNYGHMTGSGMVQGTSTPMMNYNGMGMMNGGMMNNGNGMMNYDGMGAGQNPMFQP